MRILVAMVSAIAALAGTTGHGQHWPHWRGPTHNGVVSGETNLPVAWGRRMHAHLPESCSRRRPAGPRRQRVRAAGATRAEVAGVAGVAAARKGGRSCR